MTKAFAVLANVSAIPIVTQLAYLNSTRVFITPNPTIILHSPNDAADLSNGRDFSTLSVLAFVAKQCEVFLLPNTDQDTQ